MSPYIAYYANQAGGGTVDRYTNFGRVFVGSPYHRGHGIGAFLGGVFRRILPYLGSGARAVGKEALNAGINVVGYVVTNGKPLKLTGRGSAKTSKTRKNKKKRPAAYKKSKKSELDLFTISPTQTSIENSQFVYYNPVSTLSDDAPIEFIVPGHGEEYIDLAHTMIKVRARILKPEGTAALDDSVGPVNNFLHSMFNQVDVYFNQKVVTPPNNLYAYRAYIETLLNYGTDAKSSHLGMSLWATDSYGAMDSTAVAAGDARTNNGLAARQAFTKGGKTFDLLGHLHCDVFNQDKFLMNDVELRVRLIRAKDAYCLIDDSALRYKVHIEEASLIVRRVKLSPGILIAHAKMLAKTTAKYPLTRVEVKSFVLHRGIMGETIDNAILGKVPKRIILGFVENASFNGSRKKNPFNFQNFGINFLCLNVDGRQVPTKPLQPSFISAVCLDVEAFNTLFSVRFHGATEKNINCVFYAEYDNLLEINSTRQVIVDYSG
ncbi:uncharacterized protein F54H12.2-like [Diachasmimorpha longicaudata]|uniref:uncharacterized protein F54H12.2-like n=1 Tax=Diachasmimorpha longicaudata TaxID=58733 RepID=UPI0030B86E06